MEINNEENTRRVLQIEIEPLAWEILKAKGKIKGLSPHQQAKHLLIKQMQKEGLYPERTWGEIFGETASAIIKKIEENDRKEN